MANPPAEDLEAFLRRQDAEDLVAVLLELAKDHEAVRERLARMQLADRPDKLAAGFRKTLAGWRRSTGFYGNRYGSLVPLAEALRSHDCPRGETIVYRALLKGILERANARAYGHAARYWARLNEIAGSGASLRPLPSHEEFEAEVRARHGRKPAFWAHADGTRRDRHDEAGDPDL